MKKLYAPWRHSYVTNNLHKKKPSQLENECVFCDQLKKNDDEKYFILKRFSAVFITLNYYPYNAGHLMIIPNKHYAELDQLSDTEQLQILHAITLSTSALKRAMKPDGFNVGINLGQGSGGGIPSHLHVHIVPRWKGDTNFLPILFGTKVVCSDLKELYSKLKPYF